MDEKRSVKLCVALGVTVALLLVLMAYGVAYRLEMRGTFLLNSGPGAATVQPSYRHDSAAVRIIFAPANAIDRMQRPDVWVAPQPD